ncbi:MAG: hypothetical protein V4617_20560 [Gemmatimonadota bacterium]
MPDMRRRGSAIVAMALGLAASLVGLNTPLAAQRGDSLRVQVAADTLVRATGVRPASRTRLAPPLTPRRAFLYSLMLPGFGQSRLDRGSSGALFASVELAALVMVRRSIGDVREAQRYRIDTLPASFVDAVAGITPVGQFVGRYSPDLVRTRRLHVEDWLAVVAFNHLFSAVDAYVAAQLWDVPLSLSAKRAPGGAALVATVRF